MRVKEKREKEQNHRAEQQKTYMKEFMKIYVRITGGCVRWDCLNLDVLDVLELDFRCRHVIYIS